MNNNFGFNILAQKPSAFPRDHTERSYLLDCLQRENEKAAQFLQWGLALEETIVLTQIPYERRQAKEKQGWLKCRIKATIRQEKAIIARLRQLSYELQSKRGWYQNFSNGRLMLYVCPYTLPLALHLVPTWTAQQQGKHERFPGQERQQPNPHYASEPSVQHSSGHTAGNSEVEKPHIIQRSSSMSNFEPEIRRAASSCTSRAERHGSL